jgi:hypothetical protein
MTTNYDKPFEQRPGQGGVFRNKNKTQDIQPGYTGKVMLPNGELRFMSIWVKKTKAGEPWLSISVGDIVQAQGQQQAMVLDSAKPFAAPVAPTPNPTLVARSVAAMDDDLPF